MKSSVNCRLVSLPHFESMAQDDHEELQAAMACVSLSRNGTEPHSIMVVLCGSRPVGVFATRTDAPPLLELFPGILLNENVILNEICAELEVTGVLDLACKNCYRPLRAERY